MREGKYNPRDEERDDQYTPEPVSDAVRLVQYNRRRMGLSPCCGAAIDQHETGLHCRACLKGVIDD